jgi:transcriptional regulator NrdR family protein
MTCPICGGKTMVRDTKSDCEGVYRKRICLECNHKMYTAEYESKEAISRFYELQCEYQEKRRNGKTKEVK